MFQLWVLGVKDQQEEEERESRGRRVPRRSICSGAGQGLPRGLRAPETPPGPACLHSRICLGRSGLKWGVFGGLSPLQPGRPPLQGRLGARKAARGCPDRVLRSRPRRPSPGPGKAPGFQLRSRLLRTWGPRRGEPLVRCKTRPGFPPSRPHPSRALFGRSCSLQLSGDSVRHPWRGDRPTNAPLK